jgi:DNA ligase (NAD+)
MREKAMNKKEKLEKIKILITELNKATEAYDKGKPYISDLEWDNMYFELVKLENECNFYSEKSPTQTVNYKLVNELKKVKHNHLMLSLNKTKDWNVFLNYFKSKDTVGMLKLDGLTCSLRYVDGYLISAETRGNGEIGEDVLHNAKVIKSIPKRINYKDELILDGEIICTYQNFEQWKDEYKNPRNFAAGSIRLLDAKECANRNLTFVVWNVVKGFDFNNYFINRLEKVEELGFTVTPWTSSFDWDVKEYLEEQANKLGYPIDGLVGRFNDIDFGQSLGFTAHHSNAAFAFKFYDEIYDTKLKYIDWTMGRTGVLTPVAVFEPIDINGTIVERASMHNYGIMRELLGSCAYVGEPLKVFKSNMIIPQLKPVDKKYQYDYGYVISHGGITANDEIEFCPICKGACSIEESKDGILNMVCENPQCQGKLINQLDHFCSKKGLDIKGLSKATLEKLIDWKWVSNIFDIYNLDKYKKEWMQKTGFGEKSVNNILIAIKNSTSSNLSDYIAAIGIPLIGKTVSKELVKYVKDYDDFRNKIKENFDFTTIEGFGYAMDKEIKNFDYTYADKLYNSYMNLENKNQENQNNKLNNINFVITGKLKTFKNRDAIKAAIESYGGKVTGSVTKNTQYLINNDINSTSTKNKTAKSLNIPIITEEQFLKMIDN